MHVLSYESASVRIRPDFAAAHQAYWQQLGASGTWLTGAERVAVAAEVRQARFCRLCAERKRALSPYAVEGQHDAATQLPGPWVEIVHRIVTDSARITRSWFDDVTAQGVSHAQYIEILGTLTSVFSIDEFCRGLDLALRPLPQPQPGEPSRYTPALARLGDAWVPMLPPVVDSGPEADLWRGPAGNVIRALSLVPDEVRHMLAVVKVHYLDPEVIWDVATAPKGTLSRPQTEVIAGRISAHNDCFY